MGDSVYGVDSALRRGIERHGRGYVLAVTSAQRLGLKPVEAWLEDVPGKGWRLRSRGSARSGSAPGRHQSGQGLLLSAAFRGGVDTRLRDGNGEIGGPDRAIGCAYHGCSISLGSAGRGGGSDRTTARDAPARPP